MCYIEASTERLVVNRNPQRQIEKSIAVIGMGASGFMFFLHLVEEIVARITSERPIKSLRIVIVDPEIEFRRNEVGELYCEFRGGLAISNRNDEIDEAIRLQTHPSFITTYPCLSQTTYFSWIRSDLGKYFNDLFHRALKKIQQEGVPIEVEIVRGYAEDIKRSQFDPGREQPCFEITIDSMPVYADEIVLSIGSQPNPMPWARAGNKLGFFGSQFDLTSERLYQAFSKRGELEVLVAGLGPSAVESILVCELLRTRLKIPEHKCRYTVIGSSVGSGLFHLVSSSNCTEKQASHQSKPGKSSPIEDLLSRFDEALETNLRLPSSDIGRALSIIRESNHPLSQRIELLNKILSFCQKFDCDQILDLSLLERWSKALERIEVVVGSIDPSECDFKDFSYTIRGVLVGGGKFEREGNVMISALGFSEQGLFPQSATSVDVHPLIAAMLERGLVDYVRKSAFDPTDPNSETFVERRDH
ncbi:MAG: FAD/NAD(P)-binding protein, partial [Deltaproteobacteria bacterium]|nr:FAD/NAD(P)-binding protein [Deltaproteobacteria bacterium]